MNRLLLQLAKLNVVRNIAVAFVIALGSIAITWVVNWKAQQNPAPSAAPPGMVETTPAPQVSEEVVTPVAPAQAIAPPAPAEVITPSAPVKVITPPVPVAKVPPIPPPRLTEIPEGFKRQWFTIQKPSSDDKGIAKYQMFYNEGVGIKVRVDGGYKLEGFDSEDGKDHFVKFTNTHRSPIIAKVDEPYSENILRPVRENKYRDYEYQLKLEYHNKQPVSAEQQD